MSSPSPTADCASEPIRVPGAIQPHGWLLSVNASDASVVAWSDNWSELAGDRPDALLAAFAAALQRETATLVEGEGAQSLGTHRVASRLLHVSAHRLGGLVHLELEPATEDPAARAPIYSLARHVVPLMQRTTSVNEVCAVVTAEMKRLTGFGRCLVYRFDADGHGEVLAEAVDPGYDSYQGHRFPGSDIPAQARALYRLNHLRLIPDAHYAPVPVRFADGRSTAMVLDLSQAQLRSVSPVHLEYMRNMRTLASMSVSIIVRGELWGLVSCHDHSPRMLSYPTRMACEHLGQLLSLQIEAKEENEQVNEHLKLRELTLAMVAHMADSDATLQRLVDEPQPLLRLARAAGAAVILNDECWCVGHAPDRETVLRVGRWLAGRIDEVVHTDRLGQDAPEFAGDGGAVAGGVLAISISRLHRHYVVWFRPEVTQTIAWAGDPRKDAGAPDGRLHPRRSFASWVQHVEGCSVPWRPAEVHAALELRHALIGIVLRRAEEMAEVAAELGRVNKELEAFSYTVSHDLRAPMRHISGFVDLVLEIEGDVISDRARRYLSHVKEASTHAGLLVDALLDFSRMGRASLKCTWINTDLLVDDLVAEQAGAPREGRVEWIVKHPLPRLWADPVLIQVALRNLIGNAVKYSRKREVARIEVSPVRDERGAGLVISDNGVGFHMKYVDKLFGVFQRLHRSEAFEGTGIGLASVRRIIERHGGSVHAFGEIDRGAQFTFVLPQPEGTE
jgi:chemotaxis family two-component system sensor kinase Cph1